MLASFVRYCVCVAALLGCARDFAQTAAEYQARIVRATEAYRGDCIENFDTVIYAGWYNPVSGIHISSRADDSFPPQTLTLRLPFENPASTSGRLQHITSNQTLELTATRRMLSLYDDQITLSVLDARLP